MPTSTLPKALPKARRKSVAKRSVSKTVTPKATSKKSSAKSPARASAKSPAKAKSSAKSPVKAPTLSARGKRVLSTSTAKAKSGISAKSGVAPRARAKSGIKQDTTPSLIQSWESPEPAVTQALACILAYRDLDKAKHVARVAAPAVASVVATKPANPLVVVFDIDDTLIRDRGKHSSPNPSVVALYHGLLRLGAAVHLVTARGDDADTKEWTVGQLEELGLRGHKSVHYAPDAARETMTTASKWKQSVRCMLARAAHAPIVMTVGDQWGDITPLRTDDDIDRLDDALGKRWVLVRARDGCSVWGLKLRAFS